MKKFLLALNIVSILALSACGGGSGGSSETAGPNNPGGDPIPTVTPSSEPTDAPNPTPTPNSNVPTIADVQLLGFNEENSRLVPVKSLMDDGTIDISGPHEVINIEAISEDPEKTGSVAFELQGPVTVQRAENNAIYTLFQEGENANIKAGALPPGRYTLKVWPHSDANGTGDVGYPLEMSINVIDSGDEAQLPAILALDLVSVIEPGDLQFVKTFTDGMAVNVGGLGNLFNVEAVILDPVEIGSLHFQLSGPTEIDRIENEAPYTMANESENLSAAGLAEGDYTLTVTPYSERDGGGEASRPFTIDFAVTNEPSDAPQPTPAPSSVEARNDYYSVRTGEALAISRSGGVLSNDTGASDGAQAVVQTQPTRGVLSLSADGSFTYTPNSGVQSGVDSFTYTLNGSSGEDQATVSITISSGDSGASAGFTAIVPSDDSKVIYVSSSQGSDDNDGLSQSSPVATLAKAFSLSRNGYPDHILLKRGDVWTGEDLTGIKSGRSKAEPMVVAFYGNNGPRPKLRETDKVHNGNGNNAQQHIHFIGLHLVAYKLDPDSPQFTGDPEDGANFVMLGGYKDILFEDIKFQHIELVMQGWAGSHPQDIRIRRSIFTENYYHNSSNERSHRPSHMYADNVEGLIIEESVFDYGGWSPRVDNAGGNMYNHNMYIQYDTIGSGLVIRNNIIVRASSHGVHGRPGGLFENNFFARNAVSLQMGYSGGPTLNAGTHAHAIDNVITEGMLMNRGINACSGHNLCTAAIWGLVTDNLGTGDIRAIRNIVANRNAFQDGSVTGLDGEAKLLKEDNIVYRWDSQDQGTDQGYPDPDRTLATYNASLGGEEDFDAFMDVAKNRPLHTWDPKYSANSINDYIRAGFGR